MKERRSKIVAIASGVVCAACVVAFMASAQGEADAARSEALSRYGGEQVEICVAKRDIAPGEVVSDADISTKMWVADLLPSGAVRKADEVVGKKASSSILAGEVVLNQRFNDQGSLLDIPDGLTAVSVASKDVQAVGGAVRAGSYVNVYSVGNTSTSLLCSDVLVLATSTTSASETSTASSSKEVAWITIAVKPDLVQQVVAAAQQSELYFTLPAAQQGSESGSKEDANVNGNSGNQNASWNNGQGNSSGAGAKTNSNKTSGKADANAASSSNNANTGNEAGAASAPAGNSAANNSSEANSGGNSAAQGGSNGQDAQASSGQEGQQ